uniref:Uncharacterized protein n=1 Tax=Steinernema glaseri TaxID=37863 RepID=A0A1I8ASV4_9BILA
MRRLFLIPWLLAGFTFAQQKIIEDLGSSFHNFLRGFGQTSGGGLLFGDGIHHMPVMPVVQPVPSGLEILHPPSKVPNHFFTIPPVQQQHLIKFVDIFHGATPSTPAPAEITSTTSEAPPPPPSIVQVEPPPPPEQYKAPDRLAKIIPKAISSLIPGASDPKAISREIPNRGGFDSSHYRESADVDVFEVPIKTASKSEELVDETTGPVIVQPTLTPTTSTTTEEPTTSSSTTTPTTSSSTTTTTSSATTDTDFERFLKSTNLTEDEADVLLRFVEKALDEEVKKKIDEEERHKAAGIKIHEEKEQIQSSIDDDTTSPKSQDFDPAQKHSLHQLKTAETRLNIDLKEVEETSGERGGLLQVRTPPPPRSLDTWSTAFSGADDGDYRSREQAEFDRLVSGKIGVVATTSLPRSSSFATRRPPLMVPTRMSKTNDPVRTNAPPRAITTTTSRPIIPYRKSHHAGPPTEFEKLASDYRVRLSGHNGFHDFIKALRNANIGFFQRPTYNRYNSAS